MRGHFGPIAGGAFSPDGRWVVTAGPRAAGVWEAASGRLLFFVRGNERSLEVASWAGRQTIVTADEAGAVRTYRCEVCAGLPSLMGQAEQRRRLTGRVLALAELRP